MRLTVLLMRDHFLVIAAHFQLSFICVFFFIEVVYFRQRQPIPTLVITEMVQKELNDSLRFS